MAVFLVVPTNNNMAKVRASVSKNIQPKNFYEVANNAGILVKYKGTTVELCKELEITGQPPGVPSPVGSCLVVPVTSYYGRGATEMWEWLKSRLESEA
jgi:hypothetical protein